MTYMRQADEWLDGKLQKLDTAERAELKTEIKAKLLESFRNGQKFCPTCNPKPQRTPAKPKV